jgi:hypothetical protein
LKREDGTIALTATLRDCFHDIELLVLADSGSLEITHVQADFRKSPTTACGNVSVRLQRLVGFVIGKGLNRKLMEVLGGSEGCGNLRNLLLGLLPLAMNVKAGAGISDEMEMLDAIHEQLRGTCAGYTDSEPVK